MKLKFLYAVFLSTAVTQTAYAADYVMFPTTLSVSKGTKSSVSLSALAVQDQTGTQNNWLSYIELTPATIFQGIFSFKLPSGVNASDIVGYKLSTNYLGTTSNFQLWTFRLKNQVTGALTTFGTTATASAWKWTPMNFSLSAGGAYVNSSGLLQVQYSSNNNFDVSDLDFLSLTVSTKTSTISPTPTPTPTPSPTPTPLPSGAWWKPVLGDKLAIQFANLPLVNISQATVQDVDLFDTPQATIDSLKASGKKVVCYFSAGSYENWRPDAGTFPSSVLGSPLSGWPGENWLDVRNLTVLGPIMTKRLDLGKSKKCDAIDIDNVDGFTNKTGFSITYNDQLIYNKFLATEAHNRGLAIGLKNDLLQVNDLVDAFDFEINESCFYYNECSYLLPFIAKNKPVFNIEYDVAPATFCPTANKLKFSSVFKNQNLDGYAVYCDSYPTAP
jgi:hypothetical protein